MSHWAEQVCRYGALQQYSAERHEQAHKTNLKDGWNISNHNLNYLPQVITFQRRILCFEIREFKCPSPRSASGENHCRLQSPLFRCWSGCPTQPAVISKARIHGTPKPLWWNASWCYDQRLQSITRQYARCNAPRGNIQQHAGVYKAYES